MSAADIRAKAAWLYDLTGFECAWPIEVPLDLHEYALTIAERCADQLTGTEARQLSELINNLEPLTNAAGNSCQGEAQANSGCENHYMEVSADVINIMDEWASIEAKEADRKELLAANSAVKRLNGENTRNKIIYLWNTLQLPKINRATVIAQRLEVTPQHVRRIVASEKLK